MCWGSFLNVVAYRIIRGENFVTPRSRCPHCHHVISWYDNIPVISWLLLRGRCRQCKKNISLLYPFIEVLTAATLTLLYFNIPSTYFFAYFVFFSALIVTIRSDLETMLISRFVTLFLIPVGLFFSAAGGLLPISFWQSVIGTLFGFAILFCIATFFKFATRKEGMGQGDIELLAFIGSFIGGFGCWITLFLASLIGTLVSAPYMIITRQKSSLRIPFGPFLAVGAMLFVLFYAQIMRFLF